MTAPLTILLKMKDMLVNEEEITLNIGEVVLHFVLLWNDDERALKLRPADDVSAFHNNLILCMRMNEWNFEMLDGDWEAKMSACQETLLGQMAFAIRRIRLGELVYSRKLNIFVNKCIVGTDDENATRDFFGGRYEECTICNEEFLRTPFSTCEQCSRAVCVVCRNKIDKCPLCRKSYAVINIFDE